MPLIKNLHLWVILFVSIGCVNAGNKHTKEKSISGSVIVGGLGPSFGFGDVGGSKYEKWFWGINDLDLYAVRGMYSLGYRTLFSEKWGIKATVFNANLRGDDKNSRNQNRQYAFNANLTGFNINGEYTFFRHKINKTFSHHAYGFLGLGVAYSDIDLYGNTPANYKENTTALFVPVGAGYYFQINKFSVGAELGWQQMFSDYIDGISTLYSKNNDAIGYLTFTFSYRVFVKKCECRVVWPTVW